MGMLPAWLNRVFFGAPADGQVLTYEESSKQAKFKAINVGALDFTPMRLSNVYLCNTIPVPNNLGFVQSPYTMEILYKDAYKVTTFQTRGDGEVAVHFIQIPSQRPFYIANSSNYNDSIVITVEGITINGKESITLPQNSFVEMVECHDYTNVNVIASSHAHLLALSYRLLPEPDMNYDQRKFLRVNGQGAWELVANTDLLDEVGVAIEAPYTLSKQTIGLLDETGGSRTNKLFKIQYPANIGEIRLSADFRSGGCITVANVADGADTIISLDVTNSLCWDLFTTISDLTNLSTLYGAYYYDGGGTPEQAVYFYRMFPYEMVKFYLRADYVFIVEQIGSRPV